MKTRHRFLRRVGLLLLLLLLILLLYLYCAKVKSLLTTPAVLLPDYPLVFGEDTVLKSDLNGPGLTVSVREKLFEGVSADHDGLRSAVKKVIKNM